MATIINGQPFEDILQDRRENGDFHWITSQWSASRYQHVKLRSPQDLKRDVLNSHKVQYVIQELSMKEGASLEEVTNQAKTILQEMGHNQNLSSIRFIGYFLSKFMKRLYQHVYVSLDGIKKIRSVSTQYPLLFMPTHRSYADFLLLSYVCFHYHIQTPIIAAGLDFLGLKAIRNLLRNCGAFFIRRSFGQDKLYWTIFTEYIQSILKCGDAPLEFFVEGTRSRSAKSLTPKLGLFSSALEIYMTGHVSDLTIVPISITYDRTLEEGLYAYELLGVPKPRESTRGFIKALKILKENFGNIYFTVGTPISVQEFCKGRVDRSLHNLHPRFQTELYPEEMVSCHDMARRVIHTHQQNMFLSPFPLVALTLCQELDTAEGGQASLPYSELSERVLWLKELISKTGAYIVDDGASDSSLCQALELHSNVVSAHTDGTVQLVIDANAAQHNATLNISQEVLHVAVAHMYLYHYGNQALQLLIPFSMVAATLLACRTIQVSEGLVYEKFCILRKLLQKEFVFEDGFSKEEFSFALGMLRNDGLIVLKDGFISLAKSRLDHIHFLSNLLKPFLTCYRIVCQQFFSNPREMSAVASNNVIRKLQGAVEMSLHQAGLTDYRCLSLDILNNCLQFLLCVGAVNKVKRANESAVVPKVVEISHILSEIEFFLGIEDDCLVTGTLALLPMSKL